MYRKKMMASVEAFSLNPKNNKEFTKEFTK